MTTRHVFRVFTLPSLLLLVALALSMTVSRSLAQNDDDDNARQLWGVQLDPKAKATLFQTIDARSGTRSSLLTTKLALVDAAAPSAYDADTDRIFTISSRSSDAGQRSLIEARVSAVPAHFPLQLIRRSGSSFSPLFLALLDNVPRANMVLDHNEDVQVIPLNDPSWARDKWRPRALLMNPQARHNLLMLEDDGISIVAQFSGDRQLLYRLDQDSAAPGPVALNVLKQKIYLLVADAKTLTQARLLVITMDGKVLGNVATSSDVRYMVHNEDTDALYFIGSNASGTAYYGTLNPFSGKMTVLGSFADGSLVPAKLTQPASYSDGVLSVLLTVKGSPLLVTFNVTAGMPTASTVALPSTAPLPSLVYAKQA